jgi:hypothetical protein
MIHGVLADGQILVLYVLTGIGGVFMGLKAENLIVVAQIQPTLTRREGNHDMECKG